MNWVTRYTKVSTILGEDKKNYHAGLLFLVSLDKLMKKKNELYDGIEWLQIQINKVFKCALEENFLSSSHSARFAENQTEALSYKLGWITMKMQVSASEGVNS